MGARAMLKTTVGSWVLVVASLMS
uniref:Uncharacterized protein n=1 Tax=Anguilla anguilla TaxID=7936 RepID=A0A0E9RIH9_ANGAN